MTAEMKNSILDRWVPVLVSTVIILVGAGMAYGRLEQRIISEEKARLSNDGTLMQEIMPIDQRVRLFVTRNEWDVRNQTRDSQLKSDHEAWMSALQEMKTDLKDINKKLDAIKDGR